MTNPEQQLIPKYQIETNVRDLGRGNTQAETALEMAGLSDIDPREVGRAITALRKEMPSGVRSPQLHLLFDAGEGRKAYYTATYPGESLLRLPGLKCELQEMEDGLRAREASRIEDMAVELAGLTEGDLLVGLYTQTQPDSYGAHRVPAETCDALERARLLAENHFQTVRHKLSKSVGSVAALAGLNDQRRETLEAVLREDELS